jgi:predicted nucleic acid-binding protein
VNGIADTGFIVAFANRDDHYHGWAVSLARQITEPLLTCEPVLAEAAFHLRSAQIVFDLLHDSLLELSFAMNEHLDHLDQLAIRYKDRSPDIADLCLVRMSELYPKHAVITVDSDFRVYRRNKRDLIPLLCPPAH